MLQYTSLERQLRQRRLIFGGVVALIIIMAIIGIWSIFIHSSQSKNNQDQISISTKRELATSEDDNVDNGTTLAQTDSIWSILPYVDEHLVIEGIEPLNYPTEKIKLKVQFVYTATETNSGIYDEVKYREFLNKWFVFNGLDPENYSIVYGT